VAERRKRGGQPNPHTPTEETKLRVQLLAVLGRPHHEIAKVLGIGTGRLLKHYREELDFGKVTANLKMCGALYLNGIKGNVTAQIYWMKTQAGRDWHEKYAHEHSGPGGTPIAHAVANAAISDEDAMSTYHQLVSQE
jgi:hypothetical protein